MVLEYLIKNENIRVFIKFFRLKLSFPMSLPYFFGAMLADKSTMFKLKTYINFIPVLLGSISGTLLNDYRDYYEDLNNPKKYDKPLVTGAIPREFALICGIILLILSTLISFIVFESKLIPIFSIFMSLGYYFLKTVPPFDLIINSLILPSSILAGWYSATDRLFDIKLLIFLIFFCILFYFNGAIFDYEYDEKSTVKTLGKPLSWFFLFITLIVSLYILPKKLIISKISLILNQTMFVFTEITKNWRIYTYATCIFGILIFPDILLKGF